MRLFIAPFLLLLSLSIASIKNANAQQTNMVKRGTVDLNTCVNVESQFNISVVYMGTADEGGIDPRYVEAFEKAAQRWSKIIVGDLPSAAMGNHDWFDNEFENGRTYMEEVDDVVIGYDIPATIDGPGGTLGFAGAIFVRVDSEGNAGAPISGIMVLDGADLADMPQEDVMIVIQHEMGHVLGLVGTTNDQCTGACDAETPIVTPADAERANFKYLCEGAPREFDSIAQEIVRLKLEDDGGVGTACGHWEEDVFQTPFSSELMTGFFEADLYQPISSVTVAALEDTGYYEVDYCGADIWPATADTINRFDVHKCSQGMSAGASMGRKVPKWEWDQETGEMTTWYPNGNNLNQGSLTASGTSTEEESITEASQLFTSEQFGGAILSSGVVSDRFPNLKWPCLLTVLVLSLYV